MTNYNHLTLRNMFDIIGVNKKHNNRLIIFVKKALYKNEKVLYVAFKPQYYFFDFYIIERAIFISGLEYDTRNYLYLRNMNDVDKLMSILKIMSSISGYGSWRFNNKEYSEFFNGKENLLLYILNQV